MLTLLATLLAIIAPATALDNFRHFHPWRDHNALQVDIYGEKTLVLSSIDADGKVHGTFFNLETNMSNSNIIFAHRICHPYTCHVAGATRRHQ